MERPAHTALFQSIWNHPAEENGQNVNLGSWGPLPLLFAAIIRAPANYRVVHLVILVLLLLYTYIRFVHNNSKHGRRAKRLDPTEGKYYNCKYWNNIIERKNYNFKQLVCFGWDMKKEKINNIVYLNFCNVAMVLQAGESNYWYKSMSCKKSIGRFVKSTAAQALHEK